MWVMNKRQVTDMKKKIVGLMVGLGLMTTAPVMLTGCEDPGNPPPISIDEIFVRCRFGEMSILGNNVTLKYTTNNTSVESLFYVMGLTSDNTERMLVYTPADTPDGASPDVTYTIDTNVPNGIIPLGTYYYNITASNGLTFNVNLTVVPGTIDMTNIRWNDTSERYYNGEEHEITLDEWGLPAGVSVTYTGNKATDAGTYTATAHFTCSNPNYEAIPDMTKTWTIKKSQIVLEPGLAGQASSRSQYEIYQDITFGSGIQFYADYKFPNGGALNCPLEEALNGDIEFSTNYEIFDEPGVYEVSLSNVTLKDEYTANFELDIRTGEYEVTESLVTITAQYPDGHYEILDESGNKIDYDNGGISVQFGKNYTISIVLDASHNKSNYTLQCNGVDAEVVNHTYTFRPIYDSYNFWLNNVTENTYNISCYDSDKETFIMVSYSHRHGSSFENVVDGIWFANSVDRGMIGYVEDKSNDDPMYNYTFVEWKDMDTDERADMSSLSKDMRIYATYETSYDEYSVVEIPHGVRVFYGSASVTTSSVLHYNDIITITYTVTEGYEMTNFSVENAERVGTTNEYVVKGDVSITYTEEIITYSVTDLSDNKLGYAFTTYDGSEIPETVGHNTEFIVKIVLDEAYDESDVKLYVSNSPTNIINEDNLVSLDSNGWYGLYPTDDVYFYIDGVVKNTYDVVIYDNIYGSKIYDEVMEHGETLEDFYPSIPDEPGAFFMFDEYKDAQSNVFDASTPITQDIVLTAHFTGYHHTYQVSCNSDNVTVYNDSYEVDFDSSILHYGDEITIVYNDSEYYELENITVTGADPTSKPNTYVVTGDVTITVVENDLAESVSNYSNLTFGSNGHVTPATGATISGNVEIPSVVRLANGDIYTVTKVGGFKNNTAITSVTIPSTVTEISNDAFNGCTALTSVTFATGSKLTTIGNQAFYKATSLTGMTLPSGVTTIGENAFYNTQALTTVTISATLSNLSNAAFKKCLSLQTVVIESTYTKTSLPTELFYGCTNLKSVLIKSGTSLTSLPNSMCEECVNLETFVVEGENSIESIGSNLTAVQGRQENKLSRFDLGTNTALKSIGLAAFASVKGNNLTNANLNLGTMENLETIGEQAFWGCRKLTTIDLSSTKVTVISAGAFYQCVALEEVTLPNNVTTIGNAAFVQCFKLRTINIPSSVTGIGSQAFMYCMSLESKLTITKDMVIHPTALDGAGFTYEVSSDNTTYKAVGGALYSFDMTILHYFAPKHMGETFSIPEGVTTIAENAMTDVARYSYAMEYGGELPTLNVKTIILPSTLVTISDGAFNYITSLETVTMPETSSLTTMLGAFGGCTSLKNITIPNTVTTISYGCFSYTAIEKVTIPKSVTTLEGAFEGCESLSEVIFETGSTLTTIGEDTFRGCTSLTEIALPSSVTTIGRNAFRESGITDIDLNQVTTINNNAFRDCVGLVEITITSSVNSIGVDVFAGCDSLSTITVAEGCVITEISEAMIGSVAGDIEIIYNNK